MNFFRKIFGSNRPSTPSIQAHASQEALNSLKDETTKLWNLIEETLVYYDSISCQCAFPRFRQYTRVDLVEYQGSFYMSETEGFIHHCKPYFNVQEVDKGQECYRAIWTCKKCSSTYDYAWSDFSIHVDRSFLKLKVLKVIEIGEKEKTPIPFFIGLFGHSLPDKNLFERVDFDSFKEYIRETQNRLPKRKLFGTNTLINEFTGSMTEVETTDPGWTTKYYNDQNNEYWLKYVVDDRSFHVNLMLLSPRPTTDELISIALKSPYQDEVSAAAIRLFLDEESDKTEFREKLIDKLSTLDVINLSSPEKERIKTIIEGSGLLHGINIREVVGKHYTEIEKDAQFFRTISDKARIILEQLRW